MTFFPIQAQVENLNTHSRPVKGPLNTELYYRVTLREPDLLHSCVLVAAPFYVPFPLAARGMSRALNIQPVVQEPDVLSN